MKKKLSDLTKIIINNFDTSLKSANVPPLFFNSWEHCSSTRRDVFCHSVFLSILNDAIQALPNVSQTAVDVRLTSRSPDDGRIVKWQPDIVALSREREGYCPVLYADFESPNSSDLRILAKDIEGYHRWLDNGGTQVPYILVVVLPDQTGGYWPLRYTGKTQYNSVVNGRNNELKELGPKKFWLDQFRQTLRKNPIDLSDISIINIGNGFPELLKISH